MDSISLWDKKCSKCGEIKDVSEFSRNQNKGYLSWCKECSRLYNPRRRAGSVPQKAIALNNIATGQKTCANCKQAKDLDMFYRDSGAWDGRCTWCKDCRRVHDKKMTESRMGRPRIAPLSGVKRCSTCKESKPLSEFHKNHYASDGYSYNCKPCTITNRKTPTIRNSTRKSRLKSNYGLSDDAYNAMLETQDGVCAICKRPETAKNKYGVMRLSVDHDHETGKVRGLLCSRCNLTLGAVKDNAALMLSMIAYLKHYREE